ncbi:replicase [Entoleuca gammaflexivirus 2]|uniref:Replicase n=1 Tax=Entoleuca gammaflexivirus 2 TaxID=2086642 RepID=A0AAE6HXC8_9VIRU|nr:replicase [Pistacia-associated flexivirus 1]QDO72745.1 replicase [Entoleuca gammaflexivirus 2]
MSATNPLVLLGSSLTVTEHLFNLQTDYLVQYRHLRQQVGSYSQFQLPKPAAAYCAQLGLLHDPHAPGFHSHPLSKLLEDHLLRIVLPPLLTGKAYDVMFSKPRKFVRLLQDAPPLAGYTPRLSNYVITPSDFRRYGRAPAPPIIGVGAETLFVHDALHFATPDDVLHLFRSSPQLHTLYASIVIPPGLLLNSARGHTPLYDYEVKGALIHYAPDGRWDEHYEQPLSCLWLLKTGFLRSLDLTISITTAATYDSVHLLQLTRGITHAGSPTYVTMPNTVVLPLDGAPFSDYSRRLVNKAALTFLVGYAKSVTLKSPQQLAARLRLWLGDHRENAISSSENDILAQYVYAAVTTYNHCSDRHLFPCRPHHFITRRGPIRWARLFAHSLDGRILDLARDALDPPAVRYRCHTEDLHLSSDTRPSMLTTGALPAPSIGRVRSAVHSLLYPPDRPPRALPFDPLLGVGLRSTLTRRFVASGLRLGLLCFSYRAVLPAVSIARSLLPRFSWRLVAKPSTLLFLALSAPALQLALDASGAALYHLFRRGFDLTADCLTVPVRWSLYKLMWRVPALRSMDVALHQLLVPNDEQALFEVDPELLFGISTSDQPPSSADSPPVASSPSPPPSSPPGPDTPPPSLPLPEPAAAAVDTPRAPRSAQNPSGLPLARLYPTIEADASFPERPSPPLTIGDTYSKVTLLVVNLPAPIPFAGLLSWLKYTDAPEVSFRIASGSWTGSDALEMVRSFPHFESSLNNPDLRVSWLHRVPTISYFLDAASAPGSVPCAQLPPPGESIDSPHVAVFCDELTSPDELVPWVERNPDTVFTLIGPELSPTLGSSLPLSVEYNHVGSTCRLWSRPVSLASSDPLLGRGSTFSIPEPPPPGNDTCLLDAFSAAAAVPRDEVWRVLIGLIGLNRAVVYSRKPFALGSPEVEAFALAFSCHVQVVTPQGKHSFGPRSGRPVILYHSAYHWSPIPTSRGRIPFSPTTPPGSHCQLPLADKLHFLCRQYSQQYRISVKRADATLKMFVSGSLGVLIRRKPEVLELWRSLCDAPPTATRRSIKTCGILGEPGTGKTHGFSVVVKDHWRAHPSADDITIIVGTADLRSKLCSDLSPPQGRGYRIKTWENALLQPLAPTILLDDAGLIPPILDLLLLLNPQTTKVFFTGDPCQGQYLLPADAPNQALSRSTLDLLQPSACEYKRLTHRLAADVAGRLGAVTSSAAAGSIRFVGRPFGPVVASTVGSVQSLTALGTQAFTPATCQGQTFRCAYTILADKYLAHATDAMVYTALTRGTGDVLVMDQGLFGKKAMAPRSSILRALVAASVTGSWTDFHSAVRDHKLRHTPPQLSDPIRPPGVAPPPIASLLNYPLAGTGFGDTIFAAIYHSAVYLIDTVAPTSWYISKHDYNPDVMDSALERVPFLDLHYNTLPPANRPDDFQFQGHQFIDSSSDLPFSLIDDFQLRSPRELLLNPSFTSEIIESMFPSPSVYGREVYFRGQHTVQIDTEDYATAVFLRHRRQDAATEAWTFAERYVPPKRPSTTYLGGGLALFEAYVSTYSPQVPAFNQAVYEQCEEEDQAALLEKGPKCLINISYRNDPSLDPHKAETFLKSQDVTKLGTQFRDAKKGQMITGFAAAVNSRFGPLSRYLYRATRTSLPPEILLLNGVTLEEQERWFADHWDFSSGCYEDDYTGFDGTQNEDFLAYQTLYMRAFGVPEPLIEDYLSWVTHLSCMLGPLGIMIASGFKPTWFFNTIDSMAYQALKHSLTPHHGPHPRVARAFSGDDTLHNERVTVRPEFGKLPHQFLLVSTGAHTDMPHFCGTLNTPAGSFANPELLLLRCLYKLRVGRIFQSSLGYAEHCYRLQKNLETAIPHLTSRQIACHSLTLRLLRLVLRVQGFPLVGEFLTKLLPHFYNLSGNHGPFLEQAQG